MTLTPPAAQDQAAANGCLHTAKARQVASLVSEQAIRALLLAGAAPDVERLVKTVNPRLLVASGNPTALDWLWDLERCRYCAEAFQDEVLMILKNNHSIQEDPCPPLAHLVEYVLHDTVNGENDGGERQLVADHLSRSGCTICPAINRAILL